MSGSYTCRNNSFHLPAFHLQGDGRWLLPRGTLLFLGQAVASQVGKIDAVSDYRAVAVVAVEVGTVHTISGSVASSFLCWSMCLGHRMSAQLIHPCFE